MAEMQEIIRAKQKVVAVRRFIVDVFGLLLGLAIVFAVGVTRGFDGGLVLFGFAFVGFWAMLSTGTLVWALLGEQPLSKGLDEFLLQLFLKK